MRAEIMKLLGAVDARFEPMSNGNIATSVDGAGTVDEEPTAVEDDEESVAFESARSAHGDSPDAPDEADGDITMQDNDPGSTAPSRVKSKKSKLPTPLSDEDSEEEV